MQLFKNYFGHEVKIHLVRENSLVKECLVKSPKDVYEFVKDELKKVDR